MSKRGTRVSELLRRKQSSLSSLYRKRRRLQSAIGLIVATLGGIGQAEAFVSTHRPESFPRLTQRKDPFQVSKHATTASTKPIPPLHRQSTHLQSALVFPTIPVSWLYLCALAVQFGVQPLLTKAFAPSGIIRSTFVIAQDFIRFFACWMTLIVGGTWQMSTLNWNWQGALLGAGIPSILYIVQNYFTLIAYQALPPVTFNILNQTKTLSAALCCYLLLGQKQSAIQIVALFVLLLSALVIENFLPLPWTNHTPKKVESPDNSVSTISDNNVKKERKLAAGVVPVLIASFISGLAGAVTQKSLQNLGHNAYIFSMELSAISMVIMAITLLLGSPDGKELRKSGMAKGWTWKTWIPVITNALGGVLVGLVTQHLGAVRKGFALILGLFLSGVLQSCFLSEEGISTEQIFGGILASLSMWMHSKYAPT